MKNLTMLVTGFGDSKLGNIQDNLTEWIFSETDSRDVTVIVPFTDEIGKGLETFLSWGLKFFQWGSEGGDPLYGVVTPEGGHKVISKATETFAVADQTGAISIAMGTLTAAQQSGDEIAVVSMFDPNNASDMALISRAKELKIPTYNLCDAMLDSFEGYETEEEKKEREDALAAFKEKLETEEAAVATKPATKKAAAPRKRVAKKSAVNTPPASLQEPEKALEDSPVGTQVEVGGTTFTKVGPNPFREPLPGNPIHDQTEDVWSDVAAAKAATKTPDSVSVTREDLAQLGEDIKNMGLAFASVMDTYSRIVRSV